MTQTIAGLKARVEASALAASRGGVIEEELKLARAEKELAEAEVERLAAENEAMARELRSATSGYLVWS